MSESIKDFFLFKVEIDSGFIHSIFIFNISIIFQAKFWRIICLLYSCIRFEMNIDWEYAQSKATYEIVQNQCKDIDR